MFGGWRVAAAARRSTLPRLLAPASRRRLVIPMMNKAQADIAYGFTTIAARDPAYYAYWLMNNVLGQYAMGGRLGDSIRERQGMAYYVSASSMRTSSRDRCSIRAGVSPANVDRAIASIDEELTQSARDGITAKELNESRQYLIGSMPRALETNAGIASFLQTAEFFGLGLDYDVRLPRSARGGDARRGARRRAARRCDPRSRDRRRRGTVRGSMTDVRAVFFDVDFTLIYPGPMFRGEGYRAFCERHGMEVDESRFDARGRQRGADSRSAARTSPTTPRSSSATPATSSSRWAAVATRLDACAREIYAEWAACQHFELYDDVRRRAARARGAPASASG